MTTSPSLATRIKQYAEQKQISFINYYSPKKRPNLSFCAIRLKNYDSVHEFLTELKDTEIITQDEFTNLLTEAKGEYIDSNATIIYWEFLNSYLEFPYQPN